MHSAAAKTATTLIVLATMDAFVTKLSRTDTDDESSRSVSNYDSSGERAPKRVKRHEIRNSESDDSEDSTYDDDPQARTEQRANESEDVDTSKSNHATEFENALPPTQTDHDAIEQYEQMKSSQMKDEDGGTTEKTKPLWIKGRSSIYVDAFNLALDTVLEEESQLFDEKEMEVFRKWKELTYEAQYL